MYDNIPERSLEPVVGKPDAVDRYNDKLTVKEQAKVCLEWLEYTQGLSSFEEFIAKFFPEALISYCERFTSFYEYMSEHYSA